MALPSNPGREDIWLELAESTFRNGGVNTNALKEMYAYVFGGSGAGYSRDAFGGYGIPDLASSISVSGGDGEIDVDFTINSLNDPGGSISVYAEFYDDSLGGNPSSTSTQFIGTFTTTGAKSDTITGLTNGTTYRVRLYAINVFNNNNNPPTYPGTSVNYDFTNSATATPTSPALNTPTLSGQTVDYNGSDYYLEFSYSDSEASWQAQSRINGGTANNLNIDCDNNGNPAKIRGDGINPLPDPGDTVEFRVKAIASGGTSDSAWSDWETGTEVSAISLPFCPV